jgi:hypothetical protein
MLCLERFTPENDPVQEVLWAPGPVCLLDEVVGNHECSAKSIIRAKLVGNNVKVRKVIVICVELLLISVWIECSYHGRTTSCPASPPNIKREFV